MNNLCTLYIVRHGESQANHDGLVGGFFDTLLTEKGRQQAHDAKQLLQNIAFDHAYASDLSRAVETAEIIYGQTLAADHKISGLRERNFGELEGKPADNWFAIDAQYSATYGKLPFTERWEKDFAPGIENDKAVYARVEQALLMISQQHQGRTVLVACHGGPIRILLMKLGFAQLLEAGAFANAGYIELFSDGQSLQLGEVVGVQQPHGAE